MFNNSIQSHITKAFTTAVYVLAIGLLSGCVTPYESITSGPKAEVSFNAKTLQKGGFLTITDLHFYIYKCKFEWYGRVEYSEEGNNTYFVKAKTPLYIGVSYFQNQGASSLRGNMDLSFTPKNGAKYLVEYEGLGDKFRINVYRIRASDNKRFLVKVKRGSEHWKECSAK